MVIINLTANDRFNACAYTLIGFSHHEFPQPK
jgi:hypothetical protein